MFNHWGCTSINHALSYPLKSQILMYILPKVENLTNFILSLAYETTRALNNVQF